jgi:glutamate-1-semialdehyde 2,1-aminomutase
MFAFALGVDRVTCQREWALSDRERLLRLAEAAMERGVMPDYDPREPWFLSYSHTDADIDRTLEVYAEIVKTVR